MSNNITYNHLEIKDFKLVIDRVPNVTYHCTSAPLPGVSSNPILMPTPFSTIKRPSAQVSFQPLIVTFIVDEHLKNHTEMFDWFVSYVHPDNFDEYNDEQIPKNRLNKSKMSDMTLIITNNKYNDIAEYVFEDAFPIDISDLMLDIQVDDVMVSTCTVTFEYTKYSRKR